MRIFENTDIQFIPNRKTGYIISGILLVLSVISLATRGLEVGIDFSGGMEFVLETDTQLEVTEVRTALTDVLTQAPEVKTFGANAILVRTGDEGEISAMQERIVGTVDTAFPGANPNVIKTDVVGPRFADDLRDGAIAAVLGSLLVIFVYILLRFEWRFGVGAVAALFHDVFITLGLFATFHHLLPFSLQIDQAIIAALLTIVGYSLNDTVVVFDRIREYTSLFKTEKYGRIVNRSINNTLSRTFVTSGTTLIVVTVLFIFGGEVLRGFAFALIVGIMIGTYSSIFVASPIVVELQKRAEAPVAART
ncbi:MAG: protein translocase subunit SecF [Bacteroidota bacterium]